MVLVIVGLARTWGWVEALIGALVGGIGFDYYFLPPPGIGIENPEHWIAFVAFLSTAIATGQLAAQSKRRRIEAVTQQTDTEKLYRVVNALLEGKGAESTLEELTDQLAEIFGANGIALYDRHSGQVVRSGPHADVISDQALEKTATLNPRLEDGGSMIRLAPIRHGGVPVGAIGMNGAMISQPLLSAVAARVGLGLARLYALERTTEAEVVRRSEELKSAVMDAMAHDIRNPLNSAKLAATTLLSGHLNNELHKQEMLVIIDEQLDRMDHFIDDALQLARAEASELSLKKEPLNIARLIPAAVEEMSTVVARRPIHISVPDSLPPADCDKDMVLRVLKQLLNNALKYSPEDSPITVSAELRGAGIVVDVVDGGIGVTPEERDRIFEKYYRGSTARSHAPGMGLGLASAKCIIQAHGGEIWVTSPPDGGAAFHVSLPIASTRNEVGAL